MPKPLRVELPVVAYILELPGVNYLELSATTIVSGAVGR